MIVRKPEIEPEDLRHALGVFLALMLLPTLCTLISCLNNGFTWEMVKRGFFGGLLYDAFALVMSVVIIGIGKLLR